MKARLGNATLTAKKENSINFTEHYRKFCLILHYNRVNNYVFFNGISIYRFQAKNSEVNLAPLFSGNISKDFPAGNITKAGLYGFFYDSLVN